MPKLTFCYNPGATYAGGDGSYHVGWTPQLVQQFGARVRFLAAALCSTESVPLTADDIDFVAAPYPEGSIAGLSLEIETFAYPDRVEKLTREKLLEFKDQLIGAAHNLTGVRDNDQKHLSMYGENPLVWLKYVDPRGHHV